MSEFDTIDIQVLKLIDYLIKIHEKTGTNQEFKTDYTFGYRFYRNNKYVVQEMRKSREKGSKPKHAPQLLMINIARHFNVDFNYFYNLNMEAKDALLTNNPNLAQSQESSQNFEQLNKEISRYKEENDDLLKKVFQLNQELTDCHKMAFEAQKGQTQALKELLALKSNT
ncbi:hypothetical protein HN014_04450 [Aquimarina sp. TRL1]|uniref:hypothetical protein n=1 Tax=Aquimarina sp. (strain TRL1) TaxID=2736252 RepID=UPI00158F4C6E|nr:hypothetical protein [Aquimarina sp. TRL1]QKX04189.1 hypothetical protein HN014_04450 [Aquimarina sp. TRL1]